jgi:hypothetical protein
VDVTNSDEPLPLEELNFVDPDQLSARWIAFYHYWRKEIN